MVPPMRLSWRALSIGVPLAAGVAFLAKFLRGRIQIRQSTQPSEKQQTETACNLDAVTIINNAAQQAASDANHTGSTSRTPPVVVNLGDNMDGDAVVNALSKAIEEMTNPPTEEKKKAVLDMAKNPPPEEKMKLPSQSTCTACGKPAPTGKSLLRCSRCKAVSYCSRECQSACWPAHKATCGPRAELKKKLDEATRAGCDILSKGSQRDELQRGASLCRQAAGHAADLRASLTAGLGDFPSWWP